ncbi:MAG: hypothetical protein BGO11_06730 [Solirubrobacterales bacterium 70-9]|nr:MAG: hypothetical protein BGO11_06730 [Solirubrobacterales bacterium 70-9]
MATHCFDSSSLIECWSGRYRRTTFTGLWTRLEEVAEAGEICIPEEVLDEVKKKEDGLHNFLKDRKERLVVPLDAEVMAGTKEVLAEFPRFAGEMRGRNKADPFVIATARAKGIAVVTEEGARGTKNRPKIPLACQHFSIGCISVLDYIEHKGWTFP